MKHMGFAVVLFLVPSFALAGEPLPAYAFSLRAQPAENPQINNVTVTIAVGGMHAIRVYSEPSHTLLAAFINSGDGDDFARQPWFAGLLPPRTRQAMAASLHSGMKGSVQAPLPAAGDSHLVIHTLRPAEGGAPASDDTFKVTVPDLRHFGFSLEAFPSSAPPQGAKAGDVKAMVYFRYRFRCGIDEGCGTATVLCAVNEATCCWTKDDFESCGWCGRMKGYCGTVTCDGCSPF
jgi:hypothetical protein